jgi:phage FluMu protein Com
MKKLKVIVKTKLVCNFCGHKFSKVLSLKTFEVVCPKCKEIDVEVR